MDTFFVFRLQQCSYGLYQQIASCWAHSTNTANTLLPDGIEAVTEIAVAVFHDNWQQGGHLDTPEYQHTTKMLDEGSVVLRDGVCSLSLVTCFVPDVALLNPLVAGTPGMA